MSAIKFKNTGKSLKDLRARRRKSLRIELDNKKPIGIILPIQQKRNNNDTLFAMSYDLKEQIKIKELSSPPYYF